MYLMRAVTHSKMATLQIGLAINSLLFQKDLTFYFSFDFDRVCIIAGCFTIIVLQMYCYYKCSVALPHGDVGWSAVCD